MAPIEAESMSTVEQRLITAEQLLREGSQGRCELIAGERKDMPLANPKHAEVVLNLSVLLGAYLKNSKVGKGYAGDPGFITARNPDTVRAPDLAFIAVDRVSEEKQGFVEGPPDLAVEVVSPNDRVVDVQDKATMWLDVGAKEVWVVWPNTCTISIYRPEAKPVTLREQDTLESPGLLPGFACPVADVFDQDGA